MNEYLMFGVSVRALVETAIRENLRVVGADAFGDHDLIGLVPHHPIGMDYYHKDSLPEILAGKFPSAKFLIYTASIENHPEFLLKLGRSFQIIGNTVDTLRRVRDWRILREFCHRRGHGFPETVLGEGEMPQNWDRKKWLAKPVRSGGGWRNRFHAGRGPVEFDKEFLQEYVPGVSFSCTFAGDGKQGEIIGISRQLIGLRHFGSEGFKYCGNLFPAPIPRALQRPLGLLVRELTSEFGLRGLNGIDFILSRGKIVLIEVNPRFTASMELIARAGFPNLISLHVRSSQGKLELPHWKWRNTEILGKAVCYARSGTVLRDPDFLFRCGVRDITVPAKVVQPGRPLFSLFSTGATLPHCFRRLVQKAGEMYRRVESRDGS